MNLLETRLDLSAIPNYLPRDNPLTLRWGVTAGQLVQLDIDDIRTAVGREIEYQLRN